MASNAAKLGLTKSELIEVDTHLRKAAELLEFLEKLHNTGLADLTDRLVSVSQTIDGLTKLKAQFAPADHELLGM